MSIQPVSFQNTVVDNSTENPTTTSTLTNVRSVKSLFDKGQTKCAVAASNETPSKIDSCDSLFVPKKEKVTIDNNGSNSVSNDKKAKGQIIALSLSTIIGAVLAPLTGGISLLPTAFLVLYGNAAAIAMYGGSKHFIEEKKKEFEDEEQPESPPIVQGKPARRLSNESVLDDPRLTPIQPQNIIEEDEVDSPATKGDKTGQYRVEDALDNGEIVVPKEIIKRENSLKIEHQPENKTVDEVLEWVMIEGNSTHQGNDVAELRAAIEQVSMLPIGECIGSIQGFEPDNFSKELGDITELQGLGLEFNQHCLATETIHVNDDVKFIAMQNIAGIKEADELQPISQQPNKNGNQSVQQWELSAPTEYMTKPIVTSLGSAVPMTGNYTSGVRHNVFAPNKERELLTDTNKLRPYGNDTVEAGKSTEQPQLTGNQSRPTKHWELSSPVGYMTKPIVTSLGSAVTMKGNYTQGVRHNVVTPNKERESLTDANKLRPYGNDTVEAGKSTEQPQLTGNQSKPTKHWELSAPVGYMTKSIVTSLGSAVPMIGNYTQGVRHNVVSTAELANSLKKTEKYLPINSDASGSLKEPQNDLMFAKASSNVKHWPLTAPVGYMSKPIIASVGSSVPMSGNHTSGVMHNVVSLHENLSEISSNILKNIGLDKPVSLKFMGENLPVKPIDMTQLEYLPKK